MTLECVQDTVPSVGINRSKDFLCIIRNPDKSDTMRVCEYSTLEDLEQMVNEFGYGLWIPHNFETLNKLVEDHQNKDDHRYISMTIVGYDEAPASFPSKYMLDLVNVRVTRPIKYITKPPSESMWGCFKLFLK